MSGTHERGAVKLSLFVTAGEEIKQKKQLTNDFSREETEQKADNLLTSLLEQITTYWLAY